MRTHIAAAAVFFLACCAGMKANTFIFASGPIQLSSGQVNATASFNINPSGGTISINLVNLESNPVNVGQLISSVTFTFSHLANQTTSPRLTASNISEISVDRDGMLVETSPPPANTWNIVPVSSSQLTLCEICESGGGPAELLIGGPAASGSYSAAKGSIAGNGPHNPFILASGATYVNGPLAGLNSNPTWTVSLASLQATTQVTSVRFGFGTTYGNLIANGEPVPSVPEPTTFALMSAGALLLALAIRHRSRRSANWH